MKIKATINGCVYNTESAIEIGYTTNMYRASEKARLQAGSSWYETALYKTPLSGRFFLAGRGGWMSVWSRGSSEKGWSPGYGIRPVSASQALKWAQENLPPATYEQHFVKQAA